MRTQMKTLMTGLLLCSLVIVQAQSLAGRIGVCTSPDNAALLKQSGCAYVEIGIRSFLVPDKADTAFAANMGVALITPFKQDESVDYEALNRVVDHIVRNGADYVVALATTSESPTLTEDEKKQIIKVVVQRVNGRIPIVLGLGGNCTRSIVDKLKHASIKARPKCVWRRYDHSAIYLHIAGTYTPFSLVMLRHEGIWGWLLFAIVWIAAAIGVWWSFHKMKKNDHGEAVILDSYTRCRQLTKK